MNYIVKNIYEADFGCEERIDNNGPKVLVYLEDEKSNIIKVEQEDNNLLEKKIEEGDTVTVAKDGKLLKVIRVVAAVITSENTNGDKQIFATQRGYGEFKGGWEFPGGKIEEGETPQEALRREIKEELETEIEVENLIYTVEYDYTAFHLSMDCFWCHIVSGDLVLNEHEASKWLSMNEIDSVDWLPADVELVEKIKLSF